MGEPDFFNCIVLCCIEPLFQIFLCLLVIPEFIYNLLNFLNDFQLKFIGILIHIILLTEPFQYLEIVAVPFFENPICVICKYLIICNICRSDEGISIFNPAVLSIL